MEDMKLYSRKLIVVDGRGLGTASVNVTQNLDGTFQLGDRSFPTLDALPGAQERRQTYVFLALAGKRTM
ncbi:hypothetical protein [Solidesulfovibrio sp.]|uniref:hypothetical protein n=1 Tax=Solidesulfovibrio sp. TaxID=2910990 RepID=UPI002B20D944|nr:hypothetical protein [Solidesulfovibrio sp.]MEA4856059.1 hypothetical protein [Solidesulfovibrio sp.]